MDYRQNNRNQLSPFLSSKINDILAERYSVNTETDFNHRRPQKFINNQSLEFKELENELERAIYKVELLQSEKSQLKSTMKLILEQNQSDVSPFHNSDGSGQKYHNSNPRSYKEALINDMERRLAFAERETNELRVSFQNKVEEASALRQENEYYQKKLLEVDRVNTSNAQSRDEISRLNKEILIISNRVRELEEENRQLSSMVPGDASTSQSIRYINFCLSLLEDFDSQHYTRACFNARFKDSNQIQTLISQKQLVMLGLKAFRYITDLLVNINASELYMSGVNKTEMDRRGELQKQLDSPKLINSHIMNDREINELRRDCCRSINKINQETSSHPSKMSSDTKNKQSWSYKKSNIRIDTPRTNEFDSLNDTNFNEKELSPQGSSKTSRSTIQTIGNSMAKTSFKSNDRQPLNFSTQNSEMLHLNGETSRSNISNQNSSSHHYQTFFSATPQHSAQPMSQQFSSPQNVNSYGSGAPQRHSFLKTQTQGVKKQINFDNQLSNNHLDFPSTTSPVHINLAKVPVHQSVPSYHTYVSLNNLNAGSHSDSPIARPQVDILPQPHVKPILPSQHYTHHHVHSSPIIVASPTSQTIAPEYILNNPHQSIYGGAASPFSRVPMQSFSEASNHLDNQYNLQQRTFSHSSILSDHVPYYENNSIPTRQQDLQASFVVPNSPSNNKSLFSRRMSSPKNINLSHRGSDVNFGDQRNSGTFTTFANGYRAGEGKTPSLPGSLASSQRDLSKIEEGSVYKQVLDPHTGLSRLERINLAPVGSHGGNHYFVISGQKDDIRESSADPIPEEVEAREVEKGEDLIDKETQVRESMMIDTTDRDNCKETQTSMSSRTPEAPPKKRKEVPNLHIQVAKIDSLEKKKAARSKKWQRDAEPKSATKANREKSQSNSFTMTQDKEANERLNDNSWENSVDSKRSNRSKSPSRSVSFDEEKKRYQPKDQQKRPYISTEPSRRKSSRATIGVTGNGNNPNSFSVHKSNALNLSEDNSSPLLTPTTGKSFRVSFGKTQSFNQIDGKERTKSRFDAAPNDLVCIVEAPSKGRTTSNKPRAWNIITNETASQPVEIQGTRSERLNSTSLLDSSKNEITSPRTAL